MQSEKRLICEVDSAVSAASKRSKTDEPRFRCSKCFRLGCTNIPCTGPGSKWYFSYSGLAFLLCSSWSHTHTQRFTPLLMIWLQSGFLAMWHWVLLNLDVLCYVDFVFLHRRIASCNASQEADMNGSWATTHVLISLEKILQTYDRIARTFPDGKITPSQESQALSQLQTRLHHLVSRAAQLFGMEILLLFNKPAPRTVK